MSIASIQRLTFEESQTFYSSLPAADVEHTSNDNISPYRHLVKEIVLGKYTGTYGWELSIELRPSKNIWHTLYIENTNTTQNIPLSLENVRQGIHSIDVEVWSTRFRVCEHILGVLYGLNIRGVDICIDARQKGLSWPTCEDSVSKCARLLYENSVEVNDQPEFFTVTEPVQIHFNNTRKSCITLLPDTQKNKRTIFDVHVNYPQESIGWHRRIVYERGNISILLRKISLARTNSHGRKNILLYFLPFGKPFQYIPKYGQEIPVWIHEKSVMRIYDDYIWNPNDIFWSQHECWSELLYHEVLDAMWPHGLLFGEQREWKQFSGTIISQQASHSNDIEMMKLLQTGVVETVDI